jgi:ADP-ribose pyrophosphatase YjhB (NUDIX family)
MLVDAVLIPVSIQLGPKPRVVGFRTGDDWRRRRVVHSGRQAAQDLVNELPPEYRQVVEELGITPAKVTFEEPQEDGGRITLVYTIALPAPLADPDLPGGERWITLLKSGGSQARAREQGSDLRQATGPGKDALEYWREELEEESHLFAFLPRYFTARQARDVYTAFWGYDQDPDGFASWAGIGPNKAGGVLSAHIKEHTLSDGALLKDMVQAVRKADTTIKEFDAVLLCQRASERAVGLWPRSEVIDPARPEALEPLVVAASLVAYQQPSRGPKPTWYARKDQKHVPKRLHTLYAPRAVWVFPPTGSD